MARCEGRGWVRATRSLGDFLCPWPSCPLFVFLERGDSIHALLPKTTALINALGISFSTLLVANDAEARERLDALTCDLAHQYTRWRRRWSQTTLVHNIVADAAIPRPD